MRPDVLADIPNQNANVEEGAVMIGRVHELQRELEAAE